MAKEGGFGFDKVVCPCFITAVWVGIDGSHDRISIYTVNTVPLFVQHFDGPFIPTLKLLHRCKLVGMACSTES